MNTDKKIVIKLNSYEDMKIEFNIDQIIAYDINHDGGAESTCSYITLNLHPKDASMFRDCNAIKVPITIKDLKYIKELQGV